MSSIVDDAFNCKVTAGQLGRALDALAKLSSEDRRDLTARTITLIRCFEKRFKVPVIGTVVFAIDSRLEALAHLAHHPQMKGWTMERHPDGSVPLHPTVLEAVAAEPLVLENDRPRFDPESFFRRLLLLDKRRDRA